MLDRSSKLDDSLMDAYRSIHEIHKGHAAGDSDVDKQASQLASDIRYKAKGRIKDGMNTEDKKKIYLKLLASSPAPGIVKSKAKRKLLGESVIGEEGYDHWRDKHLERGGIGAVASKSPSRPYTRSGKQPKGDTAYQKEMKAKHGGKLPSALDVVKSKIEKEHGKGAIMKTEETSAADKIINSIRSKRVDEGKLVHGPFGPYISGQKMPKEQREVPLRKVPYEDINSAKKVVGEAKVDKVKHGDHNLYDNPDKEKDRNERKFGKQSFNQKGQTQLRRGLHWSKRGEKKVKGAKVEEEVGVSSSAAMIKARQEAELKSKEEAAVKKAKKAKNEEVAPAVEKVIESIKINKASPKSPNCIIMPKKDDISDKADGNGKKSTKNVVSKKQKQFFNQEGKTYKSFVESVTQLGKQAAKQAAKGAVDVGAKTVSKETIKTAGKEIVKTAPDPAKTAAKKGNVFKQFDPNKPKASAEHIKNRVAAKVGGKKGAKFARKYDITKKSSLDLASDLHSASAVARGLVGGGGKKGPGTAPLKGVQSVRAGEGAG